MSISILGVIVLVTIAVSWLSLYYLIAFLGARDIVDMPNHRTLHQGAVPRGGGLVIVACLLLVLLAMAIETGRYAMFIALFLVVSLWASLSWWDDRKSISPATRFGVQAGIAILTVLAFGWVNAVQLSSTVWLYISWFGFVITVLGVLWMANLYNFMDGLDGLAASQTIIASVTMGFWFWSVGETSFMVVCAVLAASTYAFLLWNWQPAKIFMGDVGSITLGGFFATMLIIGVTRYDFPVTSVVLLFGFFIVDASLTIARRIICKEKFWLPHRTHYYQRLASLGISHARVVLLSIVLMLLCSVIATISMVYRDIIGFSIITELILLLCSIATVVWLESRTDITH